MEEMMHRGWCVIVLAPTLSISCTLLLAGQEPAPPPESKSAAIESSSTHKTTYSHANDLVIRGTVFNDRALSMKGVKVHIRRADEKKNRWETYSNFRGEFAVRVPQGSDYEIVAESKGFAKQSHTITDKDKHPDETVIFHMQPVTGGK
jgi:hypothetical protein